MESSAQAFAHATGVKRPRHDDPSSTAGELFHVHKPIRAQIARFDDALAELCVPGDAARRMLLIDQAHASLRLLSQTLLEHCASEDAVMLPALVSKLPTTSKHGIHDLISNWRTSHSDLTPRFEHVMQEIQAWRQDENARTSSTSCSPANSNNKNPPEDNSLCRSPDSPPFHNVLQDGRALIETVAEHLDHEEQAFLPIFTQVFTPAEQGQLLTSLLAVSLSVPLLPWTLQSLPDDATKANFLQKIHKYATSEQYNDIAACIAYGLPAREWQALLRTNPNLQNAARSKFNPLVEITHIHMAIRRELAELVTDTADIDPTDDLQLQNLSNRFDFLYRVHSCHANGEENVMIVELEKRIPDHHEHGCDIRGEHKDETTMFKLITEKVRDVQIVAATNAAAREHCKGDLFQSVSLVAQHMLSHMDKEEKQLLPLVRRYFSIEDQDLLIRRVMSKVPTDFAAELIPWMMSALTVDEYAEVVRNVLRVAPTDEFQALAAIMAQSVQLGETSQAHWDQLAIRIPGLRAYGAKAISELRGRDQAGGSAAVGEIYRVHKAIRVELRDILDVAKQIPSNSIPDPRVVALLLKRVSFLQRMVDDHSKAEDEVVLPELDARVPGVSKTYEDDHCGERQLFESLSSKLVKLQCAADPAECMSLTKSVQVLARSLRDDMTNHLKKEETQLWPLLEKHFSAQECTEIVARVFGHMPGDRLQELLPWMIRVLSVNEQHSMITQILQVTRSTMFDKWLASWCPLAASFIQNVSSEKDCSPDQESFRSDDTSAVASLLLLQGKDDVQRAIRAIAKDNSIPTTERSRLMQNLILAPFNNTIPVEEAKFPSEATLEEREVSYYSKENGTLVMGCKHYQRACKVRSPCCGKFFCCRLCHDEEVKGHSLDRFAIKEIMCMSCSTIQEVSNQCTKPDCQKKLASYFCNICNFWDDDSSKKIYHCHSCNVCRIGQGLGEDFVHCMKCNACIKISLEKDHRCIEKVMESNCPVCFQFLFTSTTALKYLQCGHLMHQSCFESYSQTSIQCPTCHKSLADMSSYFDRLDTLMAGEQMPPEYRQAKCRISCRDCNKESNVHFHFLYNKCDHCPSYNTLLISVDPNAKS